MVISYLVIHSYQLFTIKRKILGQMNKPFIELDFMQLRLSGDLDTALRKQDFGWTYPLSNLI